MKHFIILVIITLTISSHAQVKQDKLIIFFENSLGKVKADLLTEKLDYFEECLQKRYKNVSIEKAYEKFLLDIEEKSYDSIDWDNEWEIDSTKMENFREKFENTGLRRDIWLKMDAWYEDGAIHTRKEEIPTSSPNPFRRRLILNPDPIPINCDDSIKCKTKIDSIINELGKFKVNGKLSDVLSDISWHNKAVFEYSSVSYSIPEIIAGTLLSNKVDFSDYFIKRIVVIEFFEKERMTTQLSSQYNTAN